MKFADEVIKELEVRRKRGTKAEEREHSYNLKEHNLQEY